MRPISRAESIYEVPLVLSARRMGRLGRAAIGLPEGDGDYRHGKTSFGGGEYPIALVGKMWNRGYYLSVRNH